MSFNPERLLRVIKALVISEKSTLLRERQNTVVFSVLKDASKSEIKAAVEYIFETPVQVVRTIKVPGKVKRNKHGIGRRSDVKKAYVKLSQAVDIQSVSAFSEAGGV